MSQVLNCIWVLLSLWAFVHCLGRSSRRSSARRAQLFGLLCVLALLFPVISDNDDLLQQQLLSSPVSPVLKTLLKVKAVCENGTAPVNSAHPARFPSWAAQGLINEPAVFVSTTFVGATGDRSPPRFS